MITLAQAQAILDALIQQQICDPVGNIGSVSIAGRSVSYRSAADLIEQIDYWSRMVARLTAQQSGVRHGIKVARFS